MESKITFKILSENEYNENSELNGLGGCSDYNDKYGLGGSWTYQFEVEVTNQHSKAKVFTVAYQPEERSNGMRNYAGYEVATAYQYGYDADESSDLEDFCDGDTSVLDELHDKAWEAAKAEYQRLIDEA